MSNHYEAILIRQIDVLGENGLEDVEGIYAKKILLPTGVAPRWFHVDSGCDPYEAEGGAAVNEAGIVYFLLEHERLEFDDFTSDEDDDGIAGLCRHREFLTVGWKKISWIDWHQSDFSSLPVSPVCTNQNFAEHWARECAPRS